GVTTVASSEVTSTILEIGPDAGASAGAGLDRQAAAEERRPLAHAREAARARGGPLPFRVETRPMIFDLDDEATVGGERADRDRGDVRVAGDVGQRFLHDTVGGGFHVG